MKGNVCIIPARGGSKRIPRKNIKDFLGKPIISYSIKCALDSGLFETVMVSTDDKEISELALALGADVPFMRSAENSGDEATTFSVIEEVLNFYEKIGAEYDYACCIYPTAPLITVSRVKEGFNKIKSEESDCVFPIVPFSYPIWRGLKVVEDKSQMIWPEFSTTRSQDLETTYHDAGQWYWFNIAKIKKGSWTDNSTPIILNEMEVQDIDVDTDWTLAELKKRIQLGIE